MKPRQYDLMPLISGKALMLDARTARLIGDRAALDGFFLISMADGDPETLSIQGQVAVIDIFGGMSQRNWWQTNYERIGADFNGALLDPSVRAILLNIDSPGGVVSGAFDLADMIYASRDEKPIYAFVNEQATSAGYLLASSAKQIFMPRTGAVGSIGVRMMHAEYSQMDKKMGVAVTHIYAGDRKIDFNDSMPLSEAAFQEGQKSVDMAYDLFTTTIDRNRNLPPGTAAGTEAAIFEGYDAVAAGLIDGIMTFDQCLTLIANNISNRQTAV